MVPYCAKNTTEGTYGAKEVIHAEGETDTEVEVRACNEQQGNFKGLQCRQRDCEGLPDKVSVLWSDMGRGSSNACLPQAGMRPVWTNFYFLGLQIREAVRKR